MLEWGKNRNNFLSQLLGLLNVAETLGVVIVIVVYNSCSRMYILAEAGYEPRASEDIDKGRGRGQRADNRLELL